MERATRFELATASLEGWSSTPELRPLVPYCSVMSPVSPKTPVSGDLVTPTTDHCPRPSTCGVVGRPGFEPGKAKPPDLQSGLVVHLSTCPRFAPSRNPRRNTPEARVMDPCHS